VRYAEAELRADAAALTDLAKPLALVAADLEERADHAAEVGDWEAEDLATRIHEQVGVLAAPLLGVEVQGRRALRKALQKACGRKVAQKHRRNRTEAVEVVMPLSLNMSKERQEKCQ
jgi:hypothetical protein